jgi:hypothetical protein
MINEYDNKVEEEKKQADEAASLNNDIKNGEIKGEILPPKLG